MFRFPLAKFFGLSVALVVGCGGAPDFDGAGAADDEPVDVVVPASAENADTPGADPSPEVIVTNPTLDDLRACRAERSRCRSPENAPFDASAPAVGDPSPLDANPLDPSPIDPSPIDSALDDGVEGSIGGLAAESATSSLR